MPRLTYLSGVGAVGSAMACFFHPGKLIRDKWPRDNKCRLTGVLVTGKAVGVSTKGTRTATWFALPRLTMGGSSTS
jgi:hypothetical protein